jgi:hypothetical protein
MANNRQSRRPPNIDRRTSHGYRTSGKFLLFVKVPQLPRVQALTINKCDGECFLGGPVMQASRYFIISANALSELQTYRLKYGSSMFIRSTWTHAASISDSGTNSQYRVTGNVSENGIHQACLKSYQVFCINSHECECMTNETRNLEPLIYSTCD